MINRRMLLASAAVSSIAGWPSSATAVPWAAILAKLAEAAAGYIVNKMLSAATRPYSNAEILEAISDAVAELKTYIFDQARAAVTEGQLAQLRAECGAVDTVLRDFSHDADIRKLVVAYDKNVSALHLSKELDLRGLPTYAIAVSQRAIIQNAFAIARRKKEILKDFGSELKFHVDYVTQSLAEYAALLPPNVRAKNLRCSMDRPARPELVESIEYAKLLGFETNPPWMQCTAWYDGKEEVITGGQVRSGDDYDTIYGLSKSSFEQRLRQYAAYEQNVKAKFFGPIFEAVSYWKAMIDQISKG